MRNIQWNKETKTYWEQMKKGNKIEGKLNMNITLVFI